MSKNRILIDDEPKTSSAPSIDPFDFSGYSKPMSFNEKDSPIIEEPEQPVKKGRGRPKGSKSKQASAEKEVVQFNEETSIPADMVMSGAMLLLFVDFVIPGAFVFINNKIVGKKEMNLKSMQMTDDEKKKIEPYADKFVGQLQVNISPLTALTLGLISIYGTKFMLAKNS